MSSSPSPVRSTSWMLSIPHVHSSPHQSSIRIKSVPKTNCDPSQFQIEITPLSEFADTPNIAPFEIPAPPLRAGSAKDSIVVSKFDLAAANSSALTEGAEFGFEDPPHETSTTRALRRVNFINRMIKL